MALSNNYLYASSSTTIYRWKLNSNYETIGNSEIVINNMSSGGHATRTLIFDKLGRLYVSIGSDQNVDSDSFRARIRRFTLDGATFPIDFASGEVFADGLRNEVGLAFDKHDVLWGVENGPDELERSDLGGDIHSDNPAEELNRFPEADKGKHWGYPWCWSEYSLPDPFGNGVGSVWAWPSTMDTVTDEQCRSDFMPSALSMQAHSAPLGITFYEWKSQRPSGCSGGFPKSMDGYAFIPFHGSWNRDIPTGYKVTYVAMDSTGNVITGTKAKDLLKHIPSEAQWPDGFRPVDAAFDSCGRLIVTSDGTDGKGSKVVRLSYTKKSMCFSGQMPVELENGSMVPLSDIQVGTKVRVDEGKFEEIYGFGHRDAEVQAEYIRLRLSNGIQLDISGDHLVFVKEGKTVPASMLDVGDQVSVLGQKDVKIESLRMVTGKGAYAPFTYSGTIMINGVKSSTYISLQENSANLLIGSLETPFSHQWLAHSFLFPFRLYGVETWLSSLLGWFQEFFAWWLIQHPAVLFVSAPILICYCMLCNFLETVLLWPQMAVASMIVAKVLVLLHRLKVVKKVSQKHD